MFIFSELLTNTAQPADAQLHFCSAYSEFITQHTAGLWSLLLLAVFCLVPEGFGGDVERFGTW